MSDPLKVAAKYLASPPTLADGTSVPLLVDESGRLLVASSGAAETYQSTSVVGPVGGWLISGPGAVRVFSVLGTNGAPFDTAAFLLLGNAEYDPDPIVFPAPTLSLGPQALMAGRDLLGARGLLFPLGCVWGWSSSATTMQPFGGDPEEHPLFAAFQFAAGS